MKKQHVIIGVFLVVLFMGGFFSGALFSKNEAKPENEVKQSPFSTKSPDVKDMPKIEEQKSSVLIGYNQDFRDPNQVDYAKLTHVIFSFAHPEKDGSLLFTGDHAIKNLQDTVKNAKKHQTKVILAVGGWYHMNGGESYGYFSSALAKPESQKKLITELMSAVEKYNLDGIDIDFEHPRTNEDATNLTVFMKELSKQLHSKEKELSIAVHSKIHGETLTELGYVKYEPTMFEYVDYVNIMAYDGQWDGGYFAKNLSPYPFTEKIVSYWRNLFDSHKLSREKLVLGVPFYAQPENPDIKQVSYGAIVSANSKNANNDTVMMNGTTYHFNGKATMQRKTQLALKNGFGGMMIWELGHDSTGPESMVGTIFEALETTKVSGYYTLKK